MINDQTRAQPLTRSEFKARVTTWASKLGVEVNAISIRPMTTKWASCSTNGNLSFNDELLALDPELGDYVIVHELLHFSVPNHGRLWKSLMRAHLGEYETHEKQLAQLVIHSPGSGKAENRSRPEKMRA